jgi:hypothetical protein
MKVTLNEERVISVVWLKEPRGRHQEEVVV